MTQWTMSRSNNLSTTFDSTEDDSSEDQPSMIATVARETAPITYPRLRTSSRPTIVSLSETSSSQIAHQGRRVRSQGLPQSRSAPYAQVRCRTLRMSCPGPPPEFIAGSAYRATLRRLRSLHHPSQPSSRIPSPAINAVMDGQAFLTSGWFNMVYASSTPSCCLRRQLWEQNEDLTESTAQFDSIFEEELSSRLNAAVQRSQSSVSSDSSNE